MNTKTNSLEMRLATESLLPAALIGAYLATEYRVHASADAPGFSLSVGHKSDELLALMKRHKVQTAAYITAFNPLGEALSNAENQRRHKALQADLRWLRLLHFGGVGQGLGGNWTGEESFLILGLGLAKAQQLATQYDQNAYVWSDAQAVPRLVLLK